MYCDCVVSGLAKELKSSYGGVIQTEETDQIYERTNHSIRKRDPEYYGDSCKVGYSSGITQIRRRGTREGGKEGVESERYEGA